MKTRKHAQDARPLPSNNANNGMFAQPRRKNEEAEGAGEVGQKRLRPSRETSSTKSGTIRSPAEERPTEATEAISGALSTASGANVAQVAALEENVELKEAKEERRILRDEINGEKARLMAEMRAEVE